jgi:hypothetical protein
MGFSGTSPSWVSVLGAPTLPEMEQALRDRLDAFPPAARAELLYVLMRTSIAQPRSGDFWINPFDKPRWGRRADHLPRRISSCISTYRLHSISIQPMATSGWSRRSSSSWYRTTIGATAGI